MIKLKSSLLSDNTPPSSSDSFGLIHKVKTINEKIIEFKTNFAGKDMQDYIAMVLIWYATQITAGTIDGNNNEALLQALQKLDEQVNELLPQEKAE